MKPSFCSVEYVDDEGEKVIKHAFLTKQEQIAMVEKFASLGVSAAIYDLTPPQCTEELSNVLLEDGQS